MLELIRRNFSGLDFVTLHYRLQCARITSQRSRSKEIVVRRGDTMLPMCRSRSSLRQRCMLAVARQQIHPGHVIPGYQSLNFIQNRGWIKRAELRLQSMSLKPHRVTIRLARLRPPRLSHVGMRAATEGH
jgi:hypothetical protein